MAIILSIIGSLIIVTVISMFIGLKKISAPIQALTTQLKNLAEGDTTAIPVEPGRSDEIGVMQQALANLHKIVIQAFMLKQMVDDMPTNVMTVDVKNDLKVNYINNTSIKTLTTL